MPAVATTAPTLAATGAPPPGQPRKEAAQPVERPAGEHAERPAPRAERAAAGRTRAQMRLQSAALVEIERAAGEPLDGDAIEPVAEHELLCKPVAGRKQRLLDLRGRETELARRLVDPQAVHLAQRVHAPLPVGQRCKRGDERPGHGLAPAGGPLRQLGRRDLAPADHEVDRRVVRDPVEPRLDAIGHLAVAQRAVGLEQRGLRDVLTGRTRHRAGGRRTPTAGARSAGRARRTRPPRRRARRPPSCSSERRLSRSGLTTPLSARRDGPD